MSNEGTLLGEALNNFDRLRKPIKSADRVPGTTPYLGASGVVDYVDGHTHNGDYLCVSEDGENLRSRNTPIAWVQRGKFWANNHVHVLGGAPISRLRYFAAALNLANISAHLTGSAQPKLSQESLNAIPLPNVSEFDQELIGRFIGTFDDKIAANRRVAEGAKKLVVAIACRSTLETPLGDLVSLSRRSITPADMQTARVAHFSLPDFDTGSPSIVNPQEIKSSKNQLTDPVVLVSKLNPRIPRIWAIDEVPDELAVASQEFVALKPTDVPIAALWGALATPTFTTRLLSHLAGTTGSHQRVRPDQMLEVMIPDVRTLPQTDLEAVSSFIRLSNNAVRENRALAATRDELLPLLMSGKITVREAEKTVETVA